MKDLGNPHHSDVKSSDAKSAIQKVARKCTPAIFKRRDQNGEVLSTANGRVHCFLCKLKCVEGSQFTHDDLCDWKHASTRLGFREQSKDHIQVVLSATSHEMKSGRTDYALTQEGDRIKQYWRSLLKRLASVLKYACERRLALCGDDESIGSSRNGTT